MFGNPTKDDFAEFENVDRESFDASMSLQLDIGQGLNKSPSDFHYRRTPYDLAYAISVTDEILALDPLEDKLVILSKKYAQGPFEVIATIKDRVSFFAIFNLFDTVEHNHIDNQAMIQKLWIHVKKQDNEIQYLK